MEGTRRPCQNAIDPRIGNDMDANRFFKEATLRICSSLDIEVALWRCRQYIASTIPADRMYLNIYEPSINGLRYVASANKDGGQKMERSVP